MNWPWTSVPVIAVLALGANAGDAASTSATSAPLASTHPVTIELVDATHRPGGDLYVSLANPTTARYFAYGNDDVLVSGHLLSAPPPAFSLAGGAQISLGDVAVTRNLAPGVAFAFAYGNTAVANPYDLRASARYDGLFVSESALSSPYLALANGGGYGGVRLALGDDLRLRLGVAARDSLAFDTHLPISPIPADLLASAGNGMSAQTISASLDWQFADWGGVAVTAAQANERGTILGRAIAGPIAVSNAAGTSSLGVSARVGFGDGWVTTVAFNEGVTRLDLKPNWLMPGGDTVATQAYGLAVAKQGLFGDDMLGFSVSRPLQSNGMVFGDDAFGPRSRISLGGLASANHAPESDIQMGYVTTFLDGSLALQANAGYQVNVGGEKGQDAVTGVARAKINF